MTTSYNITRAHFKRAIESQDWDLLDRLLELKPKAIHDNSLFTDTWGEWWGMLMECVLGGHSDGVRILLQHGANPDLASWGDCIPTTPREAARDKPAMLALIKAGHANRYTRKREPDLNKELQLSPADERVNRAGQIESQTGLSFQPDALP